MSGVQTIRFYIDDWYINPKHEIRITRIQNFIKKKVAPTVHLFLLFAIFVIGI